MKIVWVNKITDKEYWGATQLGLTRALRKKGHKVTLVMAKNIGENKSTDEDINYFPTISSPIVSGLIFGLIIFYYFPFFIWKKKPDVVIVDGISVWLPFCLTLKLMNVPLVIDIRDFPEYKKRPLLFDISLYLSKYVIDGLTTISPELKEILQENYDLVNKKIGIWPSGVSIEKFIESSTKNNFSDQKEPDKFVLIHHGSYVGIHRGIENLIRSIGELDDSLKKITRLKIVGIRLEHQRDLSQFCEELKIEEQVKILPVVEYNKIPSYIQSSDVGIIPLATNIKRWDVSVPLKTLEYLAMGKPIIATNIPFHRRLFEKGNCGVLIDSNNPKVLSDAITYLYNNREKLETMGKTGKNIVESYYTWDIIALEVETFIKNVLADFKK